MCDFHFAWDKGSERRERKKTHDVANRDREEEEEKKVRLVSTTNTNREGRYPGIEIKLLGTTFPLFAVLDNKKERGREKETKKQRPAKKRYVCRCEQKGRNQLQWAPFRAGRVSYRGWKEKGLEPRVGERSEDGGGWTRASSTRLVLAHGAGNATCRTCVERGQAREVRQVHCGSAMRSYFSRVQHDHGSCYASGSRIGWGVDGLSCWLDSGLLSLLEAGEGSGEGVGECDLETM